METCLQNIVVLHPDYYCNNFIIVAPLKAIVGERFHDWRNRFEKFGISCAEITGDSTYDDFLMFKKSQVWFQTNGLLRNID